MANTLFDQALRRGAQDDAIAATQQAAQLAREQAEALRQRQRTEQVAAIRPSVAEFGPETASQVGGLLTSGVSALEQQGSDQLAELQRRRQSLAFEERGLSVQERASLASTEASTAASFAATALSNARIEGLGATQELALEAASRQIVATQVKNRTDFQQAVQGNTAIAAGINGVRRIMQLDRTLNDANASTLDLVNAAVLMTQVIEPGLATRNDDRMAVETGASPGVVNLTNAINQLVGGEIDIETGRTTIMRTARNLMRPLAEGTQQALEFWRVQGTATPGVPGGAVNALLGLDPFTLNALDDLNARPL